LAQPGGRELFGPSLGVAPQSQPLQGMLLRPSTDICPKELTRDVRGFFNSLLGRMHRFIRLARRLEWTFEDLDWVLRSVGKTGPNQDIDADAITQLFKIKRWQDRFELPLDLLTSLWFDMKSIGRRNPDGPEPQDLFDRVFNNPRMLRGAPAYDPTGIGPVLLLRRFDRTNPVDPYRGWLLAALELTNEELNQIAATMPANPVPLTLTNLSYLFRLSRLPRIAGVTVRELLLFFAGRGVALTQAGDQRAPAEFRCTRGEPGAAGLG
jgi:hypothetical protein